MSSLRAASRMVLPFSIVTSNPSIFKLTVLAIVSCFIEFHKRLVNHLFLEVVDNGREGVCHRLTQATLGGHLHHLGEFQKGLQVSGRLISSFHRFTAFKQLLATHTAGRTLSAGLFTEKIHIVFQYVV